MMEMVDIIRDLLKTAMKGQKGKEKKKRRDGERDKEGARRTGGAVVRGDADTWSNTGSRAEHTVFYAGEGFTEKHENSLVAFRDCSSLANRWESRRQGLL